jgi:hypothetical protein
VCVHALIRVQLCECIYYTAPQWYRGKRLRARACLFSTTTKLRVAKRDLKALSVELRVESKGGCEWKSRREARVELKVKSESKCTCKSKSK